MLLEIENDISPLRTDDAGIIRVGDTRVSLEMVVRAFQTGDRPEQIAADFETLTLADVYGVIAYYLRHREAVDSYLAERDAAAAEVRSRIEATHPAPTKAELLARKSS